MSETPVYLKPNSAAALLGVSPHTLEDWRWQRKGPPWIRVSRSCVRYDLARLQLWMAQRTIEEIPNAS